MLTCITVRSISDFTCRTVRAIFTDKFLYNHVSAINWVILIHETCAFEVCIWGVRFFTGVFAEISHFYSSVLIYCSFEQFCENEVVPLGVEAAQLQVIALANALRVKVRILRINSATSPRGTAKLNIRNFNPRPIYNSGQGSSSSGRNRHAYVVTLVYRPGRYDILYPKKRIRL